MKKNIFYVLGTGPSVNDITNEEWEYLKGKDTLSYGGFPYSGIFTKYFMTYESPQVTIEEAFQYSDMQNYYNKDIKLDILSRYGNLDTILLLYYPEDIKLARKLEFKYIIPIYRRNAWFYPSRRPWFIDEPKPPHTFKQARAHDFRQPLFRYRGSLSAAINCALILGALEIRLIGVDLNCQEDFYNDSDKWIKDEVVKKVFEEVVLPHRKKRENIRINENEWFKPENIHSTDVPYVREDWGGRVIRGMSDTIQWMDKELREEGYSGIYTTSKKSKLYNKIDYKEIMNV